jgi:MtaA/CmuA family methyltransferase
MPSFIPIVTTYTVTSDKKPLEALMEDSALLSRAFLEYRETVGYESYLLMEESTFTAEALGCKIAFKQHEAYVTEPLTFSSPKKVQDYHPPPLDKCERISLILDAVKRVASFADKERPLIVNSTAPLTVAARMLGMEDLLRKMIEQPDLVMILLAKVTDFISSFARALLASGAHMIFVADPVASPAVISPRMFGEFVMPQMKRLFTAIGGQSILHICGNVEPIAGDMAQAGAAIISLDQCVDLRRIRKLVGGDMLLGGNLDPGTLLYDGTAEEVRRASLRCCLDGGPGCFILMPGCTLVPGTPVRNIRAMMDVARGTLCADQDVRIL